MPTQPIPIDHAALHRYTWRTTCLWSLLTCPIFGAGLIFLIWAWLSRKRMRRFACETTAELQDDGIVITCPGTVSAMIHIPATAIGPILIVSGPLLRPLGIVNILIGVGVIGNQAMRHVIPGVPAHATAQVVADIRAIMPKGR